MSRSRFRLASRRRGGLVLARGLRGLRLFPPIFLVGCFLSPRLAPDGFTLAPWTSRDSKLSSPSPTPSIGLPSPAATRTPFRTPSPVPLPTPTLPAIALSVVTVPAATFQMGSPSQEAGRFSDEGLHVVTLTRGFSITATEVTQLEWARLMGNQPSGFSGQGLRPVERVSWFDALAFANEKSRAEGRNPAYDLGSCTGTPGAGDFACSGRLLAAGLDTPYAASGWRLPTEAEWELAYRGATATPWFFGTDSSLLGQYAWFSGNANGTTHPVASKQADGRGLYDMAGNVWEWVWDEHADHPTEAVVDPVGATGSGERVYRGGAWDFVATGSRAAHRERALPMFRYFNVGFRLVRTRP